MAAVPLSPPPVGNLPFGRLVGSSVFLTDSGLQFLQQLWTLATGLTPATGVFTTTTLPAAATAGAGARAFVTDATLAAVGNFGAAYVGGGTHAVPIWSTGTGWFIG